MVCKECDEGYEWEGLGGRCENGQGEPWWYWTVLGVAGLSTFLAI